LLPWASSLRHAPLLLDITTDGKKGTGKATTKTHDRLVNGRLADATCRAPRFPGRERVGGNPRVDTLEPTAVEAVNHAARAMDRPDQGGEKRRASLPVGCSIQNLAHLNVCPSAAVSGRDLASVELSGDGIAACVAGGLNLVNDRQNIAANRTALAVWAARMRFTAPTGSGVPSFVPRALAAARAALVRSEMASRSCSICVSRD
jgi:hypothetical protein